jgi:peptidoglycan/LPS O-acetylase OafA/YrhL
VALIAIGVIVAIAALQEVWLRNFLAWFVALLLFAWGNASYPKETATSALKVKLLRTLAWASQRSFCAFLIHFAFILLANTFYIALGLHAHESGLLAISLMVVLLVCLGVAANYLYRWVEVPSGKLKI